jgi:hypothetical protein
VEAPSPWGYDRDAFQAEHPGYQGGFYNPSSGFYDAPAEVAFQAPGPTGPVTIGTGTEPSYSAPGGQESADTRVPQDATPREQGQDTAPAQNDGFDLGSFIAALAAMGFDQPTGAGDHDSSNVAAY